MDATVARQRYSGIAAALHWLIAVLIIINVVLGLTNDLFADTTARQIIDLHKSIGITVLGLAIMRLLWRLMRTPPALPAAYPAWEKLFAHVAHVLLYALIFLLPLSGWMHDSAWKDAASHPMYLFGTIEWPRIAYIEHLDPATREAMHKLFGQIHTYLGYVLYFLFTLHVVGAFKHQFIDHEAELQRMWPWGSRATIRRTP